MEEVRYAPPRAAVEDVRETAAGTQPVRVWPAAGRLGRLRLFVWNSVLYAVLMVAHFAVALVAPPDGALVLAASGVAYVVYVVFLWSLLVQRTHDMGMSGWWSLLNLVPFVYLYWQFKRGEPGANAWGAPPEPNTLAVKAGAWILGFFVVLFLAFAVLGAGYAGYVGAKARQAATEPPR